MKKKIAITVIAAVLACFLVVKIFPNEYEAIVKIVGGTAPSSNTAVAANATAATPAATPADNKTATTAASGQKSDSKSGGKKSDSKKSDGKKSDGKMPQTNEEIVTKYAEVVKKFKTEKPGYTKKEYQALPEESRQFSSNLVNKLLGFADNYMTKEDSDKAIVTREKGYADIINEIPIYGME